MVYELDVFLVVENENYKTSNANILRHGEDHRDLKIAPIRSFRSATSRQTLNPILFTKSLHSETSYDPSRFHGIYDRLPRQSSSFSHFISQ